jgi:hypothetical protein
MKQRGEEKRLQYVVYKMNINEQMGNMVADSTAEPPYL